MNNLVYIIVEGKTEKEFIIELLAPFLAAKGVYLHASILGDSGRKGGDVRFSRFEKNARQFLKQQNSTIVSMMFDYYGMKKDWPGYVESKQEADHIQKADIMNQAIAEEVKRLFPDQRVSDRFIPYISMHEFEALYFSDPAVIADQLNVNQKDVDAILKEFGVPERINDTTDGAPSKRLARLKPNFNKTSDGIDIALKVGIPKMRDACPVFNDWLNRLEAVAGDANGQG